MRAFPATRPRLTLLTIALLAGTMTTLVADAPNPLRSELRSSRGATEELEAGWRNPPRLARTRCWWWWLNGNVTREAITRDLEAMKARGLGGANIIDAGGAEQRGNRQVPHGPDFASPAWRQLFVHALVEADRLGLELGLNIQSGWNLGGPTVTPEEAAKRLTWSETEVRGGVSLSVSLPAPPSRDGFYREVAVVAFPRPRAAVEGPAWTIVASSSQASFPPERAADGDRETFWVSGGAGPGAGPTTERPEWLELRFESPVAADRLVVAGRPGYGPRSCRLEALGDGGRAEELASTSLPDDRPGSIPFERRTSSRFRLVLLGAHDPRFPRQPRNVQVAEVTLLAGETVLTKRSSATGRIRNFEEKAYHRYPGGFTATESWHLLESDPDRPDDLVFPAGDVVDVSDRVDEAGVLHWEAPAGGWTILRVGYTLSASRVSTHSEGAGGLVIDYLDREAFEAYWVRVMAPILEEAGPLVGRSLRFLHTDSWELGPVNWTARMPERFRERRGYAMTPFLPALAGYVVESHEISTRFLNDFRRTIAELIAEGKYGAFSAHAHRHGLGIHPESGGPHAAPIDALLCLGRNDVPMGEFWARSRTHRVEDWQRLFVKQSASAAHIYGKRLVLAEAFTTIGPHWERDPRDLKPVFDRVACEGLNLTMLHTFDCSPPEMGVPGQVYFAGTHVNPNVTWWDQAGAFIEYLNRCHFLLQQGLFVADVLYFYGENIPAFVRLKRDDPAAALPGHDYDVTNAEALMTRAAVGDDGRIVFPDGANYRLLALPAHDAISLETLRAVAGLVEAGATVIGRRPGRPLGVAVEPGDDRQFREICDRLWGSSRGPGEAGERVFGKGRVVAGKTAREVLEGDGIGPDFTYTVSEGEGAIDFIHRSTDSADIYFLANWGTSPVAAEASFRVAMRQPEIWNPLTGEIRDAPAFWPADGRTILPLELRSGDSLFVVLRRRIPPDARGKSRSNMPVFSEALRLVGPWTVRFDPAWGGPGAVRFDELVSWTDRPESGIRHYSGRATYETTFDLPGRLGRAPDSDSRLALDLGEVKNLARVRLNDRDLGVVWTTPFRVDITDVLSSSRNRLEIDVVNLWPNRLIGDQKLPADERFTRTNVTKFTRDSPLLPSGLLGPVTLGELTCAQD